MLYPRFRPCAQKRRAPPTPALRFTPRSQPGLRSQIQHTHSPRIAPLLSRQAGRHQISGASSFPPRRNITRLCSSGFAAVSPWGARFAGGRVVGERVRHDIPLYGGITVVEGAGSGALGDVVTVSDGDLARGHIFTPEGAAKQVEGKGWAEEGHLVAGLNDAREAEEPRLARLGVARRRWPT